MSPDTDTDEAPHTTDELGYSPPNQPDSRIVFDYFDREEIVRVAGHRTRAVAIKDEETGGRPLMFECVDCGVTSNSITRFNQDACDKVVRLDR